MSAKDPGKDGGGGEEDGGEDVGAAAATQVVVLLGRAVKGFRQAMHAILTENTRSHLAPIWSLSAQHPGGFDGDTAPPAGRPPVITAGGALLSDVKVSREMSAFTDSMKSGAPDAKTTTAAAARAAAARVSALRAAAETLSVVLSRMLPAAAGVWPRPTPAEKVRMDRLSRALGQLDAVIRPSPGQKNAGAPGAPAPLAESLTPNNPGAYPTQCTSAVVGGSTASSLGCPAGHVCIMGFCVAVSGLGGSCGLTHHGPRMPGGRLPPQLDSLPPTTTTLAAHAGVCRKGLVCAPVGSSPTSNSKTRGSGAPLYVQDGVGRCAERGEAGTACGDDGDCHHPTRCAPPPISRCMIGQPIHGACLAGKMPPAPATGLSTPAGARRCLPGLRCEEPGASATAAAAGGGGGGGGGPKCVGTVGVPCGTDDECAEDLRCSEQTSRCTTEGGGAPPSMLETSEATGIVVSMRRRGGEGERQGGGQGESLRKNHGKQRGTGRQLVASASPCKRKVRSTTVAIKMEHEEPCEAADPALKDASSGEGADLGMRCGTHIDCDEGYRCGPFGDCTRRAVLLNTCDGGGNLTKAATEGVDDACCGDAPKGALPPSVCAEGLVCEIRSRTYAPVGVDGSTTGAAAATAGQAMFAPPPRHAMFGAFGARAVFVDGRPRGGGVGDSDATLRCRGDLGVACTSDSECRNEAYCGIRGRCAAQVCYYIFQSIFSLCSV